MSYMMRHGKEKDEGRGTDDERHMNYPLTRFSSLVCVLTLSSMLIQCWGKQRRGPHIDVWLWAAGQTTHTQTHTMHGDMHSSCDLSAGPPLTLLLSAPLIVRFPFSPD